MEQRLAQAHVDLQKTNANLADKTDKSDVLESRERQLDAQLAKSNLEIERLKEALESAASKAAESLKIAEGMRGKYNDTQLQLHEATGREQCVQRELDDAKNSLESEIKSVADRYLPYLHLPVPYLPSALSYLVCIDVAVLSFTEQKRNID